MMILDILFSRVIARCGLLGLFLSFSFALQAGVVFQNNTVVYYNKTSSDQLALDIRPTDATQITQISTRIGKVALGVSRVENGQPVSGKHTVILFLVDTSDPGRQQAIKSIINHIEQLLGFQQSHHLYGLASFDSDLHFLTSIGVSAETVRQKVKDLRAVGKTTELYRNTLGAIKQLSRYPADRKFLFLFSDGKAEDQAYFHRDVVQAAVKNFISLYTVGYADNAGLTVSLQTLRRLSEDTGGQYLPARPDTYQLDNNSLQRMLDTVDQGAQFHIDLSPAIQAGFGGDQDMILSIVSSVSHNAISLPIKLPPANIAIQQATSASVSGGAPTEPQVVIEEIPKTDIGQITHDYWWVFVLLLLLGTSIYFLIRLSHHLPKTNRAERVESSDDPLAWLEVVNTQDDILQRYPICSLKTKIGRYRGNDIALPDNAVSRYHAEIHLKDNGRFMVIDKGSKNGLTVNDIEVTEKSLENDDIIEIGDVRLRFILLESLADDLQETQMFRTQLPGRENHD